MSGFAVKKDGTGWRSVDGPKEDPNDPSKLYPDPDIELYSESQPDAPTPSPEQLLSDANAQRDSRLSTAALRIAPLQDAVDLGSATAPEAASLKLWKQYRIDVNRVSDQPGFPGSIEWPEQP